MQTGSLHDLDPLDVRLITELEVDARQAYIDLASKLGVSTPTIQARIQRLLDAGIIRIVCWVDHVALGYTTEVTLAINTQPDRLQAVVDSLRSLVPVRYLMLCTGRFDIIAEAMFRDREQLSGFLLDDLRLIPGLMHVESVLRLRHVKISTCLLADGKDSRPAEKPATDLDAVDLELIAQLQSEVQQTPGQLAGKLGTSESTVRRRIQRLLSQRIIKIVAVANAFALGYEGVASVGLKVDPSRINEAADAVASYRNVRTVGIYAGRYDIIAWAMFRELSDLQHFITGELSNIPGLRDMETMTNLRIAKASLWFPVEKPKERSAIEGQ